jgi:hypothetical protein
MTTQVIAAAGTVTGSLAAAAGIRVELRADRTADGRAAARRDTAVFDVVLRAESAHRAR